MKMKAKTIVRQSLLWLFALSLAAGVISCAEDNDDYLVKNDTELSDLRKEDAAIRAELQTQIEQKRSEISQRINALETTLGKLIDDDGKSIFDQLSTKMTGTKNLINQKFNGFEETIDTKLAALTGSLDQTSGQLADLLGSKQKELNDAIVQADQDNAALIEAEIAKISTLQTQISNALERLGSFESRISQLEENNAAIIDLEQDLVDLKEKYEGQADQYEQVSEQIRQMVSETIDDLTAEELNTYEEILAQVEEKTEKMLDKLDDFEELTYALEEIRTQYDNALSESEPYELIGKVEELENRASDIENLMSSFNTSPVADDYNLDDITAALESTTVWGEGELLMLVEVNVSDFSSMKEYLDGIAQECSTLLSRLDSLISEYENLRDNMFD